MKCGTHRAEEQIRIWQELDAQGFSLIPLHKDTKKPIEAEWTAYCSTQRPFNANDFKDHNAGVCCGPASGVIVVDVDVPERTDEWMRQQGHEWPRTRTVRTGSGKPHYYFQYPQDGLEYRRRDYTKLAGFEIRGDGSQVVAPGSIHPHTGLPYMVEVDASIAPMPEWLRKMALASSSGGEATECLPSTDIPSVTPEQISELHVSERIKDLIRTGVAVGQRSEAGMSVIVALLAEATPEATIYGVFEHFPIGAKYHEKRGGRHQWLAGEIGRAKAHIHQQQVSRQFHHTDVGNAQRLVVLHGDKVRYCSPWRSWLEWDARRWRLDDTNHIWELGKATARQIYEEATAETDPDRRPKLATHAAKSESEQRIKAMIHLASTDPKVVVRPDDLDTDPWLLNVMNGVVDLRTGKLLPHDPHRLITKLAPVTFEAGAKCPMWDCFLHKIMLGRAGLIGYLRRLIGYALTGDVSEQELYFLYGTGKNGKSTFLGVLEDMLGDYARTVRPEVLLLQQGDGAQHDLACLKGARFVPTIEVSAGRAFAESILKAVTGGDTISARHLYKDPFTYRPQFKIFLAANNKPQVRGTDPAIWRRINLIPFDYVVPEDERDKHLTDKLKAESPGILNWAISGCLEWQKRGDLGKPQEVVEATAGYRAEMDNTKEFFESRCVLRKEMEVSVGTLYMAYITWCNDNDIFDKERLGRKGFSRVVSEHGASQFRASGGNRDWMWRGIGLA